MSRPPLRRLLGELKRRKVLKVAATYAVIAFVTLQVVDLVVVPLGLPSFTMVLVITLLALGFPATLALTWAFELTDEGLVADLGVPPRIDNELSERADLAVPPGRVTAPAPERSIAVLPFINLSQDPENDYFSRGFTEDIIGVLSRVRDLHVVSRTSVMRYQSTELSVREIAQQLGVRTILEGSVRKDADRVRVSAQLIDAVADRHLWGEIYDRRIEDIFAVQADVSSQIATALAAELSPSEREGLERRPTADVEAYDIYLKGRHLWGLRTEEGLNKSIGYFRRALERDPRFALAEAALADIHVTLGIYGMKSPADVMPSAREAAGRALAIDPRLTEALTSLATVRALYEWDWPSAERDYRRAIELDPRYPVAHHWLASNLLTPLGRFDEARAAVRRAQELDSLSAATATTEGMISLYSGQTARAVAELSQVIDVHDDFGLAYYFLGMALEEAGEEERSRIALEKAVDLSGRSSEALSALAQVLAGPRRNEALVLEAELEARARERYVSHALFAQIKLALGDRAAALDRLEAAAEGRALDLAWLGVRPAYRPLAGEPRFQALLGRVGLPRR